MSEDKFEGNVYTIEKTNALTPTSWFFNLYIHSENDANAKLPSRVEIAFRLDSGATISVFIAAILMVITQMCNVCNRNQLNASKC